MWYFQTPSLEFKNIAYLVYSYPNAAYRAIPMLASLNTYFYKFLTSVSYVIKAFPKTHFYFMHTVNQVT